MIIELEPRPGNFGLVYIDKSPGTGEGIFVIFTHKGCFYRTPGEIELMPDGTFTCNKCLATRYTLPSDSAATIPIPPPDFGEECYVERLPKPRSQEYLHPIRSVCLWPGEKYTFIPKSLIYLVEY